VLDQLHLSLSTRNINRSVGQV